MKTSVLHVVQQDHSNFVQLVPRKLVFYMLCKRTLSILANGALKTSVLLVVQLAHSNVILIFEQVAHRVCSRDFPGREFPGIPGFFREFSREQKINGISREFPGNFPGIPGIFVAFPVSRFPGNEKSGKLQTLSGMYDCA